MTDREIGKALGSDLVRQIAIYARAAGFSVAHDRIHFPADTVRSGCGRQSSAFSNTAVIHWFEGSAPLRKQGADQSVIGSRKRELGKSGRFSNLAS